MDEVEFGRITAKWQYQQYKDSCLPTCIKNVLDNLHERVLDPRLRFSMKELHNMCKYERGLACPPDAACPSLNTILKKRGSLYRAQEKASKKNTFETLDEIIKNPNASFPIIGVHSDYHKEQGIVIEGRDYDHIIAILSIDNDNIWFHDPYRPYAEKSGFVERFNNFVPLVRMLKYWDEAWDTRWLMWIEKPRGPLDKFGVLNNDKKR